MTTGSGGGEEVGQDVAGEEAGEKLPRDSIDHEHIAIRAGLMDQKQSR